MTGEQRNGIDPSVQPHPLAQASEPSAPVEGWPEEANAAATFFSAAIFLIREGWNRLEDLGWVEEFGSESQRAILNLDDLDPYSLRALSARLRRG
jgi:hypothetical protein